MTNVLKINSKAGDTENTPRNENHIIYQGERVNM